MNLFLQGGGVATENNAPTRADVWIVDGTIKAVSVMDPPEGSRVIYCAGTNDSINVRTGQLNACSAFRHDDTVA